MTILGFEVDEARTLLEEEARTATTTSNWVENETARAVAIHLDVSASAATPSVTFTVQGRDHLGEAYDILASKAFDGTVEKDTLYIYPGAPATAEESNPALLPRYWRVVGTHADADSITYSVGYTYLP